MIRNLDLMRDLLRAVEETPLTDGKNLIGDDFFLPDHADRKEVQYHLKQLIGHKLLEGRVDVEPSEMTPDQRNAALNTRIEPAAPAVPNAEGEVPTPPYKPDVWVSSLTWEGHDFLDNISNNTTWGKVKSAVSEAGGKVGVDAIGKIATAFAMERIKHYTGLDL